jgi:hypothetical protein
MSVQSTRSAVVDLEAACRRLQIDIPVRSPLRRNIDLLRRFYADGDAKSHAELAEWKEQSRMQEVYWATFSVANLADSILELENHPDDLKRIVPLALMQDVKPDFEPTQSKTFLYELQVAAFFQKAGFNVAFGEPDLRIRGNGLSQEIGLACKFPSSEKKLEGRISHGYDQIEREGLAGIVVIGMDIMCSRGRSPFVLFPDSVEETHSGMADELSKWVYRTIKRREGVPGRKPLDGAIFSLTMVSWHPTLSLSTQFVVQRNEGSLLKDDLTVIARALPGGTQ